MTSISHMDVKFLWGNSNYDYVCSESLGNSGGILCIWEASIFKKINTTVSDNFIAIYGTWLPTNSKILFIAIYAPQQTSCKRKLWDYISNIVGRWNGESIIMGDFNEVRSSEERRGSCFNPYSARYFDRFISNAGLVDVTLEGYAFTWAHPSASKMSKLDRFLVSDGIFSLFPSITAICLDRHLSDHRPILLREVKLDFGPTPFRFYHSWFDYVGFDDMIKLSWHSFSHSDTNGMIRFKKKLQDLKKIIRSWIKAKKLGNISLIPKVMELKYVNEYRPDNLIGSVYKVVTKASILINGSRLKSILAIRGLKQDDAMFIGEWSNENLSGIINILKSFFLASGLQINILKSQLLGVCVPHQVVEQAASLIAVHRRIMQDGWSLYPHDWVNVPRVAVLGILRFNFSSKVKASWRECFFVSLGFILEL
ncbi:RNA-directed DNA polymerase, eukaryota [Tanacetum coccineum]